MVLGGGGFSLRRRADMLACCSSSARMAANITAHAPGGETSHYLACLRDKHEGTAGKHTSGVTGHMRGVDGAEPSGLELPSLERARSFASRTSLPKEGEPTPLAVDDPDLLELSRSLYPNRDSYRPQSPIERRSAQADVRKELCRRCPPVGDIIKCSRH
jgi:hypothetical protein